MPSRELIDLESLLTPISQDRPCGENLKWEPVFGEIKAARQKTDKAAFEDDTTWVPKYALVVELATQALSSRTKDLMLAGWLTEALVHLHGFGGLRDGLRLITGLVETFWDSVFPLPEDGDWELRAAPLYWLTDADKGACLPNSLKEVSLARDMDEDRVFSWLYWDARNVRGLPEDPDMAARRREEAAAMARKFDEAVAATPREFYVTLAEDIQLCRQEIERLGKRLDEYLGKLAPGTTTMRAAIDTCDELVRRILRDKPGPPIAEVGDVSTPAATTNGNGQIAGAMAGPIQSREDAFRRLEEVALFLRRTEPQSPVPYLVDRAVAWGRMPFDQLLSELIKDATQRDQVGELLGIKAPPSG